jgi:hypothetical protein
MYDYFFEDRDQWYQHETQKHQIEWFCNSQGHQRFNDKTEFIQHMEVIHNITLDTSKTPLVLEIFAYPMRGPSGDCHLCKRPARNLKSHLSRHLQQLALFALPKLIDSADLDSHENLLGSKENIILLDDPQDAHTSSSQSGRHDVMGSLQTFEDSEAPLVQETQYDPEAETHETVDWNDVGLSKLQLSTSPDLILEHIRENQTRAVETYTVSGIMNGQLRNTLAKLAECHG